jgi:hypothetical protein
MARLSVRPSVTSDKGQRLVNLEQGKFGLTLFKVVATLLPCWMVRVAAGAYGWLRGAYVGKGAHILAEGYIRLCKGRIRKIEGCIRLSEGRIWPFTLPTQPVVPPHERFCPPLCCMHLLHTC